MKRNKICLKQVVSFILAFVLLVAAMPQTALAQNLAMQQSVNEQQTEGNSVTVRFSISQGMEKFYTIDQSDEILIPKEITVPYFDLSLYGLEHYYYNPDCYSDGSQTAGTKEQADGIVTTMHVFIYVTEVLYCGIDPKDAGKGLLYESGDMENYISWEGGVGSSFMNLWNHGTNLNYYINYEYPIGTSGWGSTSDQQALKNGDIISVHLIEDLFVFGSKFSFFVVNDTDENYDENDVVDKVTLQKGESVNLSLYSSAANYMDYTTEYTLQPDTDIYWTDEAGVNGDVTSWSQEPFGNVDEHATYTDENGMLTLDTTNVEVGTYYLAALGFLDDSGLEAGPAIFELTITDDDLSNEEEEKAKADQAAADTVISKIGAIGEVTLDKENVIEEAREAYDALTEAQKSLVSNYTVLIAAETRIEQLKEEKRQEEEKTKADQEAADVVIQKIGAIGEVMLEKETLVEETREAYDGLTEDQKKLVTNYVVLTAAETRIEQLKEEKRQEEEKVKADQEAADVVIQKIGAIGEVTLEKEAYIEETRESYDGLTEDQKKLVTNYVVLIAAETRIEQLKEEKRQEEEKAKADQAAADVVIQKVGAIGEVTLEKELAIEEAREAYDGLTEDQKKLVTNYVVLTTAEIRLKQLQEDGEQQVADQVAADIVIQQIDAIGEVTLEKKISVEEVRKSYDALTEEQKSLVTNYVVLTAAETRIEQLKEEKRQEEEKAKADQVAADVVIQQIDVLGEVTLENEALVEETRESYNALTKDQKKLVINYVVLTAAETRIEQLKEEKRQEEEKAKADQEAADVVIQKIGAIGEVMLEKETLVEETREAYDGLTEDQKKLVTNYVVLTAAETRIEQLKEEKRQEEEKVKADQEAADVVIQKIGAIGEVTLEKEAYIEETRESYDGLTEEQKGLVTNYTVLTDGETRLEQLQEEKRQEEEKAEADRVAAENANKIKAQNQKAANAVVAKIAAIGTVTLESEEAIILAREAYDALTTEQKLLVTNYYILVEAEKSYEDLEAAEEAKDDEEDEVELEVGDEFTVHNYVYKVTKADGKEKTVEFVKTKKAEKKVKVPNIVKYNGVIYKVTSIGSKAFRKNTKLTSVTLGKNVMSIGSYAFDKCSKLITLTLPKNVTIIGAYAFRDCKKLKTLTIKSKSLTSSTINQKAFKGLSKKTTVKVPYSKMKSYVNLFQKCGLSKKAKVK